MIKFGEFIKNLRIERSLSLREFCRQTGLDASDWSRIERGIFRPPKSKQILGEIARVLNLTEGSDEYNTLFELTAISYVPVDLVANPSVVEKLPVFFRTMRGAKPSRKELEELIEILKEE